MPTFIFRPLKNWKPSWETSWSSCCVTANSLPSWFWTPWQGNRRPSVSFQESIRSHPLVLLETIREAQQEGSVLMGDPMNILIYLVCCGGAPFILSGQLQVHDSKAARPVLDLLGSILNDPESARQRMTWALRGIRRV